MMLPIYAPWRQRRTCGSRVFSEYIEWERSPQMGRAQEINISKKSEGASLKKKSLAQAKMKKSALICFCLPFFINL